MPKTIFKPVQLPPTQPDKCSRCPLLGLRPEGELTKGERQAYCCLGIYTADGFPPLTSKGIERSAEAYRKSQRKLHRPCDSRWDVWMSLPRRQVPVLKEAFKDRRIPYEMEMQKRYYKTLFDKRSK